MSTFTQALQIKHAEEHQKDASNPVIDDRVNNVDEVINVTEETSEQIETLFEEIQANEEVGERLEQVKQIATEALESDKADAKFGEVICITLKDLFGKTDVIQPTTMPSMESFTNPRISKQAVQISIESINIALEEIKEKNNEKRNVISRKLDQFASYVFKAKGSTIRLIEDLEKQLNDKDVVMKKGKAKLPNDLKTEGNKSLEQSFKELQEANLVIHEYTRKGIRDLVQVFRDGNIVPKFPEAKGFHEASSEEIRQTTHWFKATEEDRKYISFKCSDVLMGGLKIFAASARSSEGHTGFKGRFWRSRLLGLNISKNKIKADQEHEYLDKKEALKLLSLAKSILIEQDKIENQYKYILRSDGNEKIQFVAFDVIMANLFKNRAGSNIDDEQLRKEAKTMARIVNYTIEKNINSGISINFNLVRSARALISFIESSIDKKQSVSNEGFLGGAAGFAGGVATLFLNILPFSGLAASLGVDSKLQKNIFEKQKEIKKVNQEIIKKIMEIDASSEEKASLTDKARSLVKSDIAKENTGPSFWTIFAPYVTLAKRGSNLENLIDDHKKLCQQLKDLQERAEAEAKEKIGKEFSKDEIVQVKE